MKVVSKEIESRKERLQVDLNERLDKISIKKAQIESDTTALEMKTESLNEKRAKLAALSSTVEDMKNQK